ncbi:MAG: polysaccharide biosynthesis/export family protein [Bryobacteraceae bacterium]|jgi:polysaccharide export outer membrane protein
MRLPLRIVSAKAVAHLWICATAALCPGQTGASSGSTPPASDVVQAGPQSSEPPAKPAAGTVRERDKTGAAEAGPAANRPAQPAPAPDSPKAPAETKSAAAPTRVSPKPYVIGPLDVVDVNVWNDAKLSHIYDVSPDGTISMPLIGIVKADGLTPAELTAVIRDKLQAVAFQNAPDVNIQVVRNNSKKFYIFGGVGHPGEYPLNGETTVLDAFANCGGFHDFANKKKIRILRTPPGGGPPTTYYFNYNEVSKGKHMEKNIVLQNGDRIFVDE